VLENLDISAVVLDSGGVLLLPDPSAARATLARFGASPDDERCRRAHYAANVELDRLDGVDWRLIDRLIAADLGVDPAHLDDAHGAIEALYISTPWVPIAGAAEALLQLASAGYRLAIVSNASGTMEEQLATHRICSTSGGDAAEVAIVVDSAVVGVEKPDPAIFTFALEALSLPAEQCIYVGDTIHFDVIGARAAGLHPVHLDPYGFCPHRDHDHISCLDDLVAGLASRTRALSGG
jgi:putative hydrolase of the HAD superfamily